MDAGKISGCWPRAHTTRCVSERRWLAPDAEHGVRVVHSPTYRGPGTVRQHHRRACQSQAGTRVGTHMSPQDAVSLCPALRKPAQTAQATAKSAVSNFRDAVGRARDAFSCPKDATVTLFVQIPTCQGRRAADNAVHGAAVHERVPAQEQPRLAALQDDPRGACAETSVADDVLSSTSH